MARMGDRWSRRLGTRIIARSPVSRRSILRGGAAALVLGACGADRGGGLGDDPGDGSAMEPPPPGISIAFPEAIPEAPLSTFPLGVASGDSDLGRVSLWAQYRGISELYVAVWEMIDEAFGDLLVLTPAAAGAEGFTQLELDGLTAGAWHSFAFVEVVERKVVSCSALARFRAALAPSALTTLRFGASCCTQPGFSLAPIGHAGDRVDLDFFALLGDTTYTGGSRSRTQYRECWLRSLGQAEYRRLRASTSVLATWDDHEVANNWDPETIDPAQLAEAAGAFFEHLPVRRNRQRPDQIYRSTRWGRTAEIFVLDSRSERRPSTRLREDAQYLSRAQMDWLKGGLAASPCTFKVILNSVPITNFPSLFDVVANDRWEGYWSARNEILSFIDNERIGGVLWLSGDFHFGSIGRVSRSGFGSQAVEVLVGPGAQDPNPIWGTLVDDAQFDFTTGTNNYAVFDLDPASHTAVVTFHDRNGAVLTTKSYVV
jgi:alkaline phosphatase D